jgi:hypothetical protein
LAAELKLCAILEALAPTSTNAVGQNPRAAVSGIHLLEWGRGGAFQHRTLQVVLLGGSSALLRGFRGLRRPAPQLEQQLGQVALLDYWYPDRFQKASPTEEINVGVKLKVSDLFEAGIYRYWRNEERKTGIEACTWIRLDHLRKEVDGFPDEPPGPEDAWEFWFSSNGSYFITRSMREPELVELGFRLDELMMYYISLMTKVGGVKHFLG